MGLAWFLDKTRLNWSGVWPLWNRSGAKKRSRETKVWGRRTLELTVVDQLVDRPLSRGGQGQWEFGGEE